MASTPPKPLKQLGEFLQEQEEPFILEVYLLERGCRKKRLNSEGNFSCCHRNSTKFLKRSVSCGLNKENNGIPRWSKLLKAVYKMLDSNKEDQRTKSSENIKEEYHVTAMVEDDKEVKESDRFSSASSTTVFNSCSETEEEISTSPCKYHTFFDGETFRDLNRSNIRAKEAATGRKLRRICMEDSKQLNPMSVLEQLRSHEETAQRNARLKQEENCTACPKKVFEDSESLAPLPKARCIGVVESRGLGPLGEYSNPSPQFLKQTKQLLFDCVREVVQTHAKERGQQQFLGPEELGKLICERMKLWGKQAGDETDIVYFLGLDILDLGKEWRSFEQQKREIELEIGDAVLEDIKDEIVTEMISFLAPPRR